MKLHLHLMERYVIGVVRVFKSFEIQHFIFALFVYILYVDKEEDLVLIQDPSIETSVVVVKGLVASEPIEYLDPTTYIHSGIFSSNRSSLR